MTDQDGIFIINHSRKSAPEAIFYEFVIIIFFLSICGQSSASMVQFSLAHNATDNIFHSCQAPGDQITSAGIYFGADSGSIALYGSSDLNYLYKYSGLSSMAGKLGADYLVPAGSRSAFYFALEAEGVLFRTLYDYFNHGTIRFLSNFKSYLNASTILRLDANIQLRKYKYSIFDYFSEDLTLSVDRYFSTRTTAKVEASYGYKLYFHPGVITSTENGETLRETSGVSSVMSATRNGLVSILTQQGPGGDHGNPGSNYEMGGSYSIRGVPYQTVYYTGNQGIQVFAVSGLIAQGLGDHLGLSFGGSKQWYLKGENPFNSSDEYFMVENPTYDRFSWQGYSLQTKLTAELSERLHNEFQYEYLFREFPGITSLDLEGNSLGITRQDKRHQFNIKVQIDLSRLSLFVNYSYLKNNSNDPWFTWEGSVISGGLVWNINVSQSK
jgi:hypothetical protein